MPAIERLEAWSQVVECRKTARNISSKTDERDSMSPSFSKINLVVATFSDNLARVSKSNSEGKTEISSGFVTLIEINKITMAMLRFAARNASSNIVGSGMISTTSTPNKPSDNNNSVCWYALASGFCAVTSMSA